MKRTVIIIIILILAVSAICIAIFSIIDRDRTAFVNLAKLYEEFEYKTEAIHLLSKWKGDEATLMRSYLEFVVSFYKKDQAIVAQKAEELRKILIDPVKINKLSGGFTFQAACDHLAQHDLLFCRTGDARTSHTFVQSAYELYKKILESEKERKAI